MKLRRRFESSNFQRSLIAILLSIGCVGSVLADAQAEPRYILLGEVHDNPAGHAQRLAEIERLIASGMRPAIAMEQFDADRQTTLTLALAHCPNAACVAQMAGNKRWTWKFYEPVIALAMKYQLPLLAANLSRANAMNVAKEGTFSAALEPAIIQAYHLTHQVPPAVMAAQEAAIEKGHCGEVPPGMSRGLAMAQIARDAQMAWVMQQSTASYVLLLAGNGHVRKDADVPVWLQRGGATSIRSVAYLEQGDTTTAAERAQEYDAVVVVPDHARGDACLTLRNAGTGMGAAAGTSK